MNGKIWVLGDAVVDLLPDGEGRLLQCPGGAPANVAVGVARLGGDSGFIGRVGDDPFGRFMRHTLAQEQVDVNYMRLDAAQRTSTVVVDLDSHGERTFTFMVRPSADLFLQPEDLPPFAAGQWLHVCSIALSAEPSRSTTFAAMEAIKRAGGYVSFDPNIRSDLWQDPQDLRDCLDRALALADAIKLSEEELAFISGSDDIVSGIARLNARFQPTLLLVTQGKAGSRPPCAGRLATSCPPGGGRRYHRRRRCLCRRATRRPRRPRYPGQPRSPGSRPRAGANLRRAGHHRQRRHDRPALQGRSSALAVIPLGRLTAHFAGDITILKPV